MSVCLSVSVDLSESVCLSVSLFSMCLFVCECVRLDCDEVNVVCKRLFIYPDVSYFFCQSMSGIEDDQ